MVLKRSAIWKLLLYVRKKKKVVVNMIPILKR